MATRHPNAADGEQVNAQERMARRRERRSDQAVRTVMSSREGRAFVWSLLERAGVFRSVWSPNAQIHYNAGRQDFGHELMGLLVKNDHKLYLDMEREARELAAQEAGEIAAAATRQGAHDDD